MAGAGCFLHRRWTSLAPLSFLNCAGGIRGRAQPQAAVVAIVALPDLPTGQAAVSMVHPHAGGTTRSVVAAAVRGPPVPADHTHGTVVISHANGWVDVVIAAGDWHGGTCGRPGSEWVGQNNYSDKVTEICMKLRVACCAIRGVEGANERCACPSFLRCT
eukprot:gene15205-biopygen5179